MLWTRLLSVFLLIGLPTLALPPACEDLPSIPRVVHHEALWRAAPEHLTYDNILFFLNELESGALEERCSENDLDEINLFLVRLGELGLLSNADAEAFDEDSEELLNPDYLAYDTDTSYQLTPAIGFGAFKAEFHKVGLRKFWKKTKKWCKKHKKKLIIGSVIVAIVAIVATVAVLKSGGSGVASTAATGGSSVGNSVAPGVAIGGAAIGSIVGNNSAENQETRAPLTETVLERPDLANILDDHCGEMKDAIAADMEVIQAEGSGRSASLTEVGRVYGAATAESAFREAAENPSTAQEIGLNLSKDPETFSRECDQAVDKIHESFGLEKPSQASVAPLAAGAAAARLPGGPLVKATAAVGAMAAVATFPEETQRVCDAISDGVGYACDRAVEYACSAGESVQEWVSSRVQEKPTVHLEAQANFQDDRILQAPEEYFEGHPDRDLPHKPGGEPMPDVDVPHTQLGTREGGKGKYRQTMEFDKDGRPTRRIDWTDHGRVDHTNPHQHRYVENETGGTRTIEDGESVSELNYGDGNGV